VLSLNDVSLRRGRRLLFEHATLQAHDGQRIGLIGPNGCGKSSLLALLLGQLDTDRGEVHVGSSRRIAHIAQESPSGTHTALDHVIGGDRILCAVQAALREAERDGDDERLHVLYERLEDVDGFTAEARAGRLLSGLGFAPEDAGRPVGAFSGGWKMRLNLARALMCPSDLLLLDEPTNHLDLPAIIWLEQWLARYPGIVLVVSHDRDFLDAVCTRIAHFEHGRITLYSGNYSQFEDKHREMLAQQQAMYKRQQQEIRHIQGYIDRFRYKASKARQAQSRLKMLERMTVIAAAHVDSGFHFSFAEPERQPRHLLRLEDVTAGYETPVLQAVDISIAAGDRLGLMGMNGAGKSTLMKALADGSTVLDGARVTGRESRIAYFAQHQLDQLDPALSPADHLRALMADEPESELRRYLGGFGFSGDRIYEPVAPFSGGEKARLVLAMIVRQRPNLLLLDEPTNHLDLDMRRALEVALAGFEGALVLISHDRHLLRSVCDELLLVHDGAVTPFDGDLESYARWLQEQRSASGGAESESLPQGPSGRVDRKARRQHKARARQQLQPLTDRVRAIEKQLAARRQELRRIEERLADNTLYTDAARKPELTGLIRDQADLESTVAALESEWLEASEMLERASDRQR
jgi:ATP-binding cassette subfamily F protein 3